MFAVVVVVVMFELCYRFLANAHQNYFFWSFQKSSWSFVWVFWVLRDPHLKFFHHVNEIKLKNLAELEALTLSQQMAPPYLPILGKVGNFGLVSEIKREREMKNYLKVPFFRKWDSFFKSPNLPKKLFQKTTILSLKFEIPAHISKQLIQISSSG